MRSAAPLVVLLSASPVPVVAEIASARFAEPTDRYDHAILGDAIEWGALLLRLRDGRRITFRLPDAMVFEDLSPRLADLDGDGAPEVIVVETFLDRGARLAVWDETGRIAATDALGETHRWLAPAGAGDLDGDGRAEVAYVETPHRTGTLRIVRLVGGRLAEVASASGLSNHRIGDDYIQGGIAICPDGPVIVTADTGWSRVVATRLEGGRLRPGDRGPYRGPASLGPKRACARL
ncbi:MAG: FG-GAP repeat domain-containing protein [Paracoccaceae bacterium]